MITEPVITGFTTEQLNELFAHAYYNAVINGTDMMQTATLLEPLRKSIGNYPPLQAWSLVTLDRERFDKEPFIQLLIDLQNQYYKAYAEMITGKITKAMEENLEYGWKLWLVNYVEALLQGIPEVTEALKVEKMKMAEIYRDLQARYCKLNDYFIQSRWVDCYEMILELAAINWLLPEHKARLLIFAGQVYLYWFPDSYLARQHIDEASKVLPGSAKVERAYAEYYRVMGNFEEARSHLVNAQIKEPDELDNLLLSADISKDQGIPEVAEGKYNDALSRNFMFTNTYSSLVVLYSNPALFKSKKSSIENLVQKVNLLETGSVLKTSYYNILRDAGYTFSLNQEYAISENYYNKAIVLQPENCAAIIDLAYILANQEKYEASEKLFNKAIETDPAVFEAYWGLGWLFSLQKNLDKALDCYNRCLTFRPIWNGYIYYTIGTMYENQEQFATAKNYFEKSVEANPSSSEYVSKLAGIYEKMQQFPEAITWYKKTLEIDEKDSLSWNKLGNIYYDLSDFSNAKICYRKALDNDKNTVVYFKNLGLAHRQLNEWQESLQAYNDALKLMPDDPETLNAIGIAWYGLKNFEESIHYYRQAIAAAAKTSEKNNLDFYWANIGLSYRDQGKTEEAEKAYLQALSINPNSADNQNYIGILYYQAKNYVKAIEHYKKALELTSDSKIYENLGLAYFDNNELENAIVNFNEAIKTDPESHTSYNYLGNVYFKQCEYIQARVQYEAAIRLQPENPVYLSNVGLTYYFEKLYKDALQFFNKSLAYDPDYLLALNYGGNCNLILGEYTMAENRYRHCIALQPEESFYFSNLGISLIKQNKIEEAEENLQHAFSLNNDNPDAITNLGYIAYRKGELEKAKEYYYKAFPGSTDDPENYFGLLHPQYN